MPAEPRFRPHVRVPGGMHDTAAPAGLSPAQVRRAYAIDFKYGDVVADGRGQTIALVGGAAPTAEADMAVFCAAFGLPGPPSLRKVDQNGGTDYPAELSNWGLEAALDSQWAHAVAPGADLLLVCCDDLVRGVTWALAQPEVSVVSLSWSAAEWPTAASWDVRLTPPAGRAVTLVASSGDTPGPQWPAVSPLVLAVGGTNLAVALDGTYLSESAWAGGGGGESQYVPRPAWQDGVVPPTPRGNRCVPDVSYNAGTTVPVYYSGMGGWVPTYGTSAGAPQWAALVAMVNQRLALRGERPLGTVDLARWLYALPPGVLRDVLAYPAGPGYDLITGLGTPLGWRLCGGDEPGPVPPPPPPPPPPPVLTSLRLSPAAVNLKVRQRVQFSAVGLDQHGVPLARQPVLTWGLVGVGTLGRTGAYTAPAKPGAATVTASAGGVSGHATVKVVR